MLNTAGQLKGKEWKCLLEFWKSIFLFKFSLNLSHTIRQLFESVYMCVCHRLTRLPDGLQTSGQRAKCKFLYTSTHVGFFLFQ